ncbi:MAG: hypothetical protein KJO40_16580 [Deltaproteobacteria bacterium]|nr:hypothetical protein [Deltaproteobacteria bacterium]NND29985.1 hypothetical protein [Myxococcales bacterium]MBT8465386.1 hypothetical protein [Deltaproteobacteria bacterium]NNK06224.1 hypothetical protein [Myxococcales bacterium]NNK41784.1 hypothetical protein [Myxococcales bacterium]
MRRLVIPLASYLAVTIVVPILNGASIDADFREHAALAIALPLIIATMLSLVLRCQRFVIVEGHVSSSLAPW